jgi:para-nitrobenzyl esterase
MEFDGERIARRGIVVVTVNYRLNVFGFLAHPELTAQQPDAPTNFGHLDQQAGTRWVKRNIAAFGGDPENITIGGQSAGGGSVCAQLTSPQNEGLFQKAVIMSGIMGSPLPSRFKMGGPLDAAEAKGVAFFEHMGVKTLAEARALPAEFVRDKTLDFPQMFATSVDGVFQVAPHLARLMTGKRLPVPLMVSRTSNEFLSTITADDLAGLQALAEQTFGPDAGAFLSLVGEDKAAWAERTRFSGVEVAARCLSDRSSLSGIGAPIYYSVFDPSIPGWDNPGTFHSSDLWFWFETLAKCWRAFKGYHFDLARQMCNYLCNFVRSGDPNGPDNDGAPMPLWEPLTGEHPAAMRWTDAGATPYLDVPTPLMQLLMKTWLKQY